ncbi:MAG: CHAT domain-containing protein [Gemmatimonadota bacterium]|nr:CHAT domain-containing protein [Gemmatimonadota bacterium]MDH5283350.1 CHAT domain-containing protein [Gemmatimonadota bacterium]
MPPESLFAAGQERYDRGSYDSARAIWRVELRRGREAADSPGEAWVLMWLGNAAWRLGEYDDARRDGEAALTLKRQLGLDRDLSRSFNSLGLVAWEVGRLGDALTLYDSAIASARRHDDTLGIARATANLALARSDLGDFDAARAGFLSARKTAHALGHAILEGNSLTNLGMLEIRLGNPVGAIAFLAEARRLYRQIDYQTGEVNALGQLATAWSAMGDLQRAIVLVDSSLTLARSMGLLQEVASDLEVLADLHLQAGAVQLALQRLREADSLDAALGLAMERATNLRREAVVLLALGQPEAAVARAREALASHLAMGSSPEVVHDRLWLATALQQAGDKPGATAQADSARAEARRLRNPATSHDAAVVAARLALEDGEARRALRYIDAAESPVPEADWVAPELRAAGLAMLGQLEKAREAAGLSVVRLERERASLGVGPLRSAYLVDRTGPFARLVAIELARHDTTAAFEVAASVAGRGLAEHLGGVGGGAWDALPGVLEGERLLRRVAMIEQELETLPPDEFTAERRAALQRRLATSRSDYEEFLGRRAASPGASVLGADRVRLEAVQAALADDQALLTYLAGPERLDLFVVRRLSLTHAGLPIGEAALRGRLRLAREVLAAGRGGNGTPQVLGELHQQLLGPALASGTLDGVTRLIVVAHGPLAAIPFGALWNRATGRFLVQDVVITYLPTVAALSLPLPALEHGESRLSLFAPLDDSLPGSLREARAIGRRFPTAELRRGSRASELEVRRALAGGRMVHVASHGEHNPRNPLFSRISLGAGTPGDGADDGWLEVHEILGLRTASPLVFLSGCETGLAAAGSALFGGAAEEGSLAQAFLFAGARSVVATLWRVEDAEAALLAERFYAHLRSHSPAEALALAQREAVARAGGYTWAAYILTEVPGPGAAAPAPR